MRLWWKNKEREHSASLAASLPFPRPPTSPPEAITNEGAPKTLFLILSSPPWCSMVHHGIIGFLHSLSKQSQSTLIIIAGWQILVVEVHLDVLHV